MPPPSPAEADGSHSGTSAAGTSGSGGSTAAQAVVGNDASGYNPAIIQAVQQRLNALRAEHPGASDAALKKDLEQSVDGWINSHLPKGPTSPNEQMTQGIHDLLSNYSNPTDAPKQAPRPPSPPTTSADVQPPTTGKA